MDKKGEKVTPKNCYANPARPDICIFLALGCYISVNQNKFNRKSDNEPERVMPGHKDHNHTGLL